MGGVGGFLVEQLADAGAAFAVGTFGALAEFIRQPGEPVRLVAGADRYTVVTPAGALRVSLSSLESPPDGVLARAWQRPTGADGAWSHSVAVCLPAARASGPAREVITVLGADTEAARPADRGATLVDLGLGVPHLEACVRTADPALLARLRAAAGQPFAACPSLAPALVEGGPHRVFRTVAARAEVYTPIPPPTGTSPAGPHTHLLPALLAHRRTHPASDPIPSGLVPVLTVFPGHPNRDALGRPTPYQPGRAEAFDQVLARWGDPDELHAYRTVLSSVRAGEPARARPAGLSRAGRRGWEVALRRLQAAGETTPTWSAWRAAAPVPHDQTPYHLAH
ncbi:MAG TPA: hypothetical protein VGH89_34580 [Pseudonocardia sp.]|jgi:hypothetical protein